MFLMFLIQLTHRSQVMGLHKPLVFLMFLMFLNQLKTLKTLKALKTLKTQAPGSQIWDFLMLFNSKLTGLKSWDSGASCVFNVFNVLKSINSQV